MPADLSVTDYQCTEFRPDLFQDGQKLLTVCTRGYTRGNVFNYGYWACPCGWWPGEELGPPPFRCYNCHRPLYVSSREEANTEIIISIKRHKYMPPLVGFKIAWVRPQETP